MHIDSLLQIIFSIEQSKVKFPFSLPIFGAQTFSGMIVYLLVNCSDCVINAIMLYEAKKKTQKKLKSVWMYCVRACMTFYSVSKSMVSCFFFILWLLLNHICTVVAYVIGSYVFVYQAN